MPDEQLTFSQDASDKHTAGKYLVTKKGDLVLVHLTVTAGASEYGKAEPNKKTVAFFRAPAPIQSLQCAGDKIVVGCQNGEVLHLRVALLVDKSASSMTMYACYALVILCVCVYTHL